MERTAQAGSVVYRVFFVNHGYYMDGEFATIGAAVNAAIKAHFDAGIDRVGEATDRVAGWGVFNGLRFYSDTEAAAYRGECPDVVAAVKAAGGDSLLPSEKAILVEAAVAACKGAPTIQPGTRCGCSAGPNSECHQRSSYCQRDAVRMVTVPYAVARPRGGAEADRRPIAVPMCAPCAEYHAKVGAK